MTLSDVLAAFGTSPQDRLGGGGEADVYAIDADRVLRLCHDTSDQAARLSLLKRLEDGAKTEGLTIPRVLDHGVRGGHAFSIEERIDGEAMDVALTTSKGADRRNVLESYLETANRIGALLEADEYRELGVENPIASTNPADFYAGLIARSFATGGFSGHLDVTLPTAPRAGLVHLDYFPGNVMVSEGRVSAVLDFGYATVLADRRMNPVVAASYLGGRMSGTGQAQDRLFAQDWLADHGLSGWVEDVTLWLAGYWAFAIDDDPELASIALPLLQSAGIKRHPI